MLGIKKSLLAPPAVDQLEITIFGPGFGEAIVCHLGGGVWLVVDSCLDPQTRMPVSASYLNALGVDVASSIRLIVITHFDNDHTAGIAKLVQKCPNATVAISSALHSEEFIEFLAASDMLERKRIPTAAKEIRMLMDVLVEDGRRPVFASANKDLWHLPTNASGHAYPVTVRSLSPSSHDEYNAKLEFASLVPELEHRLLSNRRVSRNDYSVVIWIDAGFGRILLGADLQQTADDNRGWSAVLGGRGMLTGRASVFKIPHHGAINGDNPEVWAELLEPMPIALVTPYNKAPEKQKLPRDTDIERILRYTPNGHITHHPMARLGRNIPQQIDKLIRRGPGRLSPVPRSVGCVRARTCGGGLPGAWEVEHLTLNASPLAKLSGRAARK